LTVVLLLLNGVLIAGIYALGREAAHQGVSALALLYWQSVSSAILVSLVAAVLGERPRFSPRYLRHYALTGLLGAAAPLLAAFLSIQGSVSAILLAVLAPLLLVAGRTHRTHAWPAGLSPLGVASGMLIAQALLLDPIAAYAHAFVLPSTAGTRLDWALIGTAVLSGAFYVSALMLTAAGPGRKKLLWST